jgi:hypothetical protein
MSHALCNKLLLQPTSHKHPPLITQLEALSQDDADAPCVRQVAAELHAFARIQFTYGEVQDVKQVLTVVDQHVSQLPADSPALRQILSLLLELLFQENSKPLHRQVLNLVRKLPADKLGG